MKLFTCNENINIFKGINWDIFAITGSIMSACCPIYNPLISYFENDNLNESEIFNKYIGEYYNNSDIDIMCNCVKIIDFIQSVIDLHNIINKNINDICKIDTELINIKNITIYVSREYIHKNLINDDRNIDYIIKNFNNDIQIKKIIYKDYLNYHANKISKYINNNIFTNDKFNFFFEPGNLNDIKIYLSNEDNKYKLNENNADNDIYFYENIKFKILKNKILKRDIEIFNIKYNNFFSIVSKFHLPCVRAYYRNDNIYMLPSFVTAMMTFINIDYKYFSGNASPFNIINKYRYRGFTTILNDKEKNKI